jgi:hypothetical protein
MIISLVVSVKYSLSSPKKKFFLLEKPEPHPPKPPAHPEDSDFSLPIMEN